MKLHTVKRWFGGYEELYNAFNSGPITLSNFKVPASILKQFNDFATDDDKYRAIGVIGDLYIDAMINAPNTKKLKYLDFNWLEPNDREYLKDALIKAIEHAVRNKMVWEKVNASTITTSNFTMNEDSTAWLLSADMFGQFARTSLANAEINLYEVIGSEVYTKTQNGNYHLIGRISEDTLKELPELVLEGDL